MRKLLAAGLALYVVLAAAAPHVHTGPHGAQECAVCVARTGAVAENATPDLAPVAVLVGEPTAAPGLPPVTGAPLGAVPGQSPPLVG